jgi:4a-hydroxytetrahydrobiopterin dehydratase
LTLLGEDDIKKKLKEHEGWRHREDCLVKSYDRGDFKGAVEFVSKIVAPADEMNHHPDVAIAWSQVEVSVTSHDEGGITEADFELIGKIDELA